MLIEYLVVDMDYSMRKLLIRYLEYVLIEIIEHLTEKQIKSK
jgi:hypothetical protein